MSLSLHFSKPGLQRRPQSILHPQARAFYLINTSNHRLRKQPTRRPRIIRCQLHIGQVQVESHYTVQPNTTTAVRRTATLLEDVDVLLETRLVRVNALLTHTCLELRRVVDTLPTTHNLLSAHEEIVRVGHLRVGRVLLGVKRPRRLGEFVEDVEIGTVLLADDGAQGLFLRSRHVFVVGHVAELFGALLTEELLALGEGEADFFAIFGQGEGF